MASIEARVSKLEKEAGLGKENITFKTVFCEDGENVEDACRRLEMPITETDNPNIFFVQFISSRDEI